MPVVYRGQISQSCI